MTIYPTLVLALSVLAAPAMAQEVAIGGDRYAVVLPRADRHPTTPAAARQAVARIERAVMAVCGASTGSLYEMRQAVRGSACWRDSMATVRGRIGDPLLVQAWQARFAAEDAR